MALFILHNSNNFPSPGTADPDGLLAFGSNLQPETLLKAYAMGIFPWFDADSPVPLWWSPPQRMVMLPGEHRVSASMRQLMNKKQFSCSFDRDFPSVIRHCAGVHRKDQEGTWITTEMIEAYEKLHKLGYAHSMEVWQRDELVGGLYGVSLGGVFCGESMFSLVPNASKYAFIMLSALLKEHGFILIDCQNYTPHLEKLGARLISREDFLKMLGKAMQLPTHRGNWRYMSVARVCGMA